jgi:hypothetical protein
MPTVTETRRLPNGAFRVVLSTGHLVFVTAHTTAHHGKRDSRAWAAVPLFGAGHGVPLTDLTRTARTRRDAIAAAAVAFAASQWAVPGDDA